MKQTKLLLLVFILLSTVGCWGSRETDEIAYTMALGFDKGPGNNVIMTFQIVNPRSVAGNSSGDESANQTLFTATTVAGLPIAAFNLINIERSREISLLHTTAYVFSEELARDGVHDYISPFTRFRQVRGSAYVFVCKGKASEFLKKNKPVLEISPSKQYEQISLVNETHSLSTVTRFHEFYQNTKSSKRQPVVPMVGINEVGLNISKVAERDRLGDYEAGNSPSDKGVSQFIGAAVFLKDKMVGELTGDETRYYNIMTGNMKRSFIIIKDPLYPENNLGMTLLQARRPEIKVDFKDGIPEIEQNIYLEPELVGIPSEYNYEATDKKPILEEAIRLFVENNCNNLMSKVQQQYKSDIFGFGRYASMKFINNKDWDNSRWEEVFPTARYSSHVYVKIRRTGLIIKSKQVE